MSVLDYIASLSARIFTLNSKTGSTIDSGMKAYSLVFLLLLSSMALAQESNTLSLNTTSVSPGAQIILHYRLAQPLASDAWVGLIPSHIPHGSGFQNDQYDLAHLYLNQKLEGDLTINAPANGGNYDFRLNSSDNNGTELATVSFVVEGTATPTEVKPTLQLSKLVFKPDEDINVQFTAPAGYALDAWVGIVPSHIPHGKESKNDQYDLSYIFLNNRTEGTLTFAAPSTKGTYDIRMNDTDKNGNEVASVSFKVN